MRCGNLKHRQQSGANTCASLPPYLTNASSRRGHWSLATTHPTSISPTSQVNIHTDIRIYLHTSYTIPLPLSNDNIALLLLLLNPGRDSSGGQC